MPALLNPKVWIGIFIAVVLAFTHFFVWRSGKATVRNDFDTYKLAQQEQRILADRARSLLAAARQAAVNKEARDGQERIAALETDVAGARADGERMRNLYRTTAQRARELSRTASTGTGQPDSDPIGVFALLLERADTRAEIVGGYADRLRIAGSICERGWDAGLQPKQLP
ncbi:hypothetical protein J2W35_004967 [Variovorax boronicumulans]|uniref:DUF2514 family protein n=1 Tax=Variovorax boronicumulans TaxID=436515 RepID=UPI0027877C81|nr:DUF2514 family protein [Variovorax boronicumulans]MDQ0084598.1 hypothetical protein [Variovorax boronicumulans]